MSTCKNIDGNSLIIIQYSYSDFLSALNPSFYPWFVHTKDPNTVHLFIKHVSEVSLKLPLIPTNISFHFLKENLIQLTQETP